MAQQTTKKLTLKPLGNRVLVQRTEQEETSKAELFFPILQRKSRKLQK